MHRHTIKQTIVALLVFPLAVACGKNASMAQYAQLSSVDGVPNNDSSTDSNGNSSIDTSSDNGNTITNKTMICSDLNLDGVVFSSSLSDFSINAFSLAMNISGSYEGHTGWDNISNNFDGQGLSLGLFNQNLGQGSLQPLMIGLRDSKNAKFKSFFTSAQYSSVNSMLTAWGGVSTTLSKAVSKKTYTEDYSDLDDLDAVAAADGEEISSNMSAEDNFSKAAVSKQQESVNWAVANLYSGSSFKTAWKSALQAMARSPEYISQQAKAAESIHNKARGYMSTYNLNTMRAYLFFFDIVVQNGGITTSIKTKYMTWLKSNTSASENTKLKKLLEYRLTLVKSQYVGDVRSRKTAIIDGTGTVHGSKRNFPKEYCVNSWSVPYAEASLNLL
jgi:hypothetical protein